MTIQEFHSNIREYLNAGQSRSRTPEVIDSAIYSGVNDLFGEDMMIYTQSNFQIITDTLGFFLSDEEKTMAAGSVDLPANMHFITELEAVLANNTRVPLIEIKDNSWSRRKNSPAYGPTDKFPIARQAKGKLEVLPVPASGIQGVTKVKIFFIRKPAVPKFNYDEVAGGYGWAYKSSGSVEVDWPEITHNRIMLKALGYLGIPTNNVSAMQAEQQKKQSGA